MFADGNGVPRDYNLARKYYKLSAEQGFSWAQFNLAVMYKDGQGVDKDLNEAKKWATKAAETGLEDAKKFLKTLDELPK